MHAYPLSGKMLYASLFLAAMALMLALPSAAASPVVFHPFDSSNTTAHELSNEALALSVGSAAALKEAASACDDVSQAIAAQKKSCANSTWAPSCLKDKAEAEAYKLAAKASLKAARAAAEKVSQMAADAEAAAEAGRW